MVMLRKMVSGDDGDGDGDGDGDDDVHGTVVIMMIRCVN
jgi:hypothetical protein